MVVQSPQNASVSPPVDALEVGAPDAGVIDDARARQQRQRTNLARCALGAILVGCAISLVAGGAHERRPSRSQPPIGDLASCTARQLRPASSVAGLAGSLAVTVEVAN